MNKYLDKTFWSTSTGFFVVILLVVAFILALGYYNDRTYGPDGNQIIDQDASQTTP